MEVRDVAIHHDNLCPLSLVNNAHQPPKSGRNATNNNSNVIVCLRSVNCVVEVEEWSVKQRRRSLIGEKIKHLII